MFIDGYIDDATDQRLLLSTEADLDRVEERLALEAHLRDTAQLATIGQLAAEIAHEVGTPLGVIAGRARSIQNQRFPLNGSNAPRR